MRRAALSLGLLGVFALALTLSVAPQWHERIHADATQTQHECAITVIAAGNYHHAAPAIVAAPAAVVEFVHGATLNPIWVASPFLVASIFEHAPPQNS